MLSDTHCHFSRMEERGEDIRALLASLEESNFRFVLDIGTRPGDLSRRMDLTSSSGVNGGRVFPPFLHFSCGLWPDADIIASRQESLSALESDIRYMINLAGERAGADRTVLAALGECGLDRFWNGEKAAERIRMAEAGNNVLPQTDDGPGTTDTDGEEELFASQLLMASRFGLPVIIHSRDAFEPTFSVVRDCGYFRGVIHCFSYGVEEARRFLDLGFFISFPGNITFPKKSADKERMATLLRYVPLDMMLLETDAPYLAPAPERGTVNTPLKIKYTYSVASDYLGISVEKLAEIVYMNSVSAFSLQKPN